MNWRNASLKMESSTRKKILLALALSASCYAFTHLVYVLTDPGQDLGNLREPIAYTTRVNENVQRRPVARMIWHLLNTGEPVYPGEAIRTSSDSEVRIQFVGSDRTLDLEADTMVILTKNENEISLDLLDGSVFVAQNESSTTPASGDKLTLNSKQGQIDLSKATASLSKSQDKVDLQVVKGEAQLKGQTENQIFKSGDSDSQIKALEPLGDKPLFVTGLNPRPVVFKWTGAVEGSSVELWLGKNRKDLKLQSRLIQKVDSQVLVQLRPGKYFWQVRGPKTLQSQLLRFEILPLAPPQPLTPVDQASVLSTDNPAPVEFTWSNPPGASSATFELSRDPGFKDVLKTEVVDSSKTFISVPVGQGKYYWRVSTYYADHHQMAAAPSRQVEIIIGERKIAKVAWDPKLQSEIFFVDQPKLALAWNEIETETAKSWLVRFAPTESDLNNPTSEKIIQLETRNQKIESILPSPGRWVASIEGRDASGKKVAVSEIKEFIASELPLLESPRILPEEGDLISTQSGSVKLQWNAIEGTAEYLISMKSKDGAEVLNKKSSQPSLQLIDLLPGQYQITVTGKDSHGRFSKDPKSRTLIVPESSGLSAPKLRKMKVN